MTAEDSHIIVHHENTKLATKPLEILKQAEETFTAAMQQLSAALIQDTDSYETAEIHKWAANADKSIKMFKDNARERLLSFLTEKGRTVTEKGTLEIDFGNGWRQRAVPTNTKPNDRLTEQMLREKGLSINEYMDKEISYLANDKKLRELLDAEQITEAEYKRCFGPTLYRVGQPERVEEEE